MDFQAIIHYKNDEEVTGPVRDDFWQALEDLSTLVNGEVESEDGFDPENVQFAQVNCEDE